MNFHYRYMLFSKLLTTFDPPDSHGSWASSCCQKWKCWWAREAKVGSFKKNTAKVNVVSLNKPTINLGTPFIFQGICKIRMTVFSHKENIALLSSSALPSINWISTVPCSYLDHLSFLIYTFTSVLNTSFYLKKRSVT